MGSFIEFNDTLQITREQGFPPELDLARHLLEPIKLAEVLGREFEFTQKPGIRNFHQPPVRVFLVENIKGKWVYWGLIQILEVTHDYERKTTSGRFMISYLNSADEMTQAFNLIDRRPEFDYFAGPGKRS